MPKIILFNPSTRQNVYMRTNVRVGAPHYPSLTLATLAGNLVRENEVKIIDLDLPLYSYKYLFDEIKNLKVDVVASSAITPNYYEIKKIMGMVKKTYPHIQTILGGIHATALPNEVTKENCFDVIVVGEGDNTLTEILSSSSLKDIKGIIYKESASANRVVTGTREIAKDLNAFIGLRILAIFLALFFAVRFSAVINDLFDIDCDSLSNRARPLVTGIISYGEYLLVGLVYFTFSLLFSIVL